MRHALTAALATAAIVVAGCSGGSGMSSSSGSGSGLSPAGRALSWHPCAQQGAALQYASLQVPLDYRHPGGRKITLALSEVPATAPVSQRQGVLLVNPGGPGGSGLSLAAFVAQGLKHSVASEYDIVGFATRGDDSSVPAMHCDPAFFSRSRANYIPATTADEQVLENRAKAYAADCASKYGWLLPYMTTQNIARDMDSIRAAMRQQQLSYFRDSYGTYIRPVYATLFPHRAHRMGLDSIVDPTGAWWTDNIQQDYAFQGPIP